MTHGVEGLQHCNFLKSITDARDIRKKVMENFEKASLPTTTDEERRQLLSFVICGGGNYSLVSHISPPPAFGEG
jgi:NADH dehydrogenase